MQKYYYYTTHLTSVKDNLKRLLGSAWIDYYIYTYKNKYTFEIWLYPEQAHILQSYLKNYFIK